MVDRLAEKQTLHIDTLCKTRFLPTFPCSSTDPVSVPAELRVEVLLPTSRSGTTSIASIVEEQRETHACNATREAFGPFWISADSHYQQLLVLASHCRPVLKAWMGT